MTQTEANASPKDAALKLALEALEGADMIDCDMRDAITAIKEALAQPEQEPVGINGLTEAETNATASVFGLVSTTPPQEQRSCDMRTWVGLTDEDIKEAEWLLSAIKEHEAYTLQEQLLVEGVDVFARAIEAKLREKNT